MSKFGKRRLIALAIVLTVLAAGAATVYGNRGVVRAVVDQLQGNDFPGPGYGEVQLIVEPGDSGEVIAKKLFEAGVVKNSRTSYQYILDANPVFYPGTFKLRYEMSTAEAVRVLTDQNAAQVLRVTIREGLRSSAIFSLLARETGVAVNDFKTLFNEPQKFGLSADLKNIEGYLFPATYSFSPDISAQQILQDMINRTLQEIEVFKIPENKVHDVLTMASIIEKEARQKDDFYKVSRVFLNRLATDMPLQSDATVSYGIDGDTVSTSDSDRSNDNPYNTYLYPGLPIGPISSPGSTAIDAALNPADGDWLYFVTINLETGETVFSNSYQDHLKAVATWLQWMKENPGYE